MLYLDRSLLPPPSALKVVVSVRPVYQLFVIIAGAPVRDGTLCPDYLSGIRPSSARYDSISTSPEIWSDLSHPEFCGLTMNIYANASKSFLYPLC
jgi:hypothetical protein